MKIVKTLLVVIAAVAGGALGGAAAFSYLVGTMPADFGGFNVSSMPVNSKPVVTIQENKALKDAVAKVANTAVAIKTTTAKGTAYGSGVILTSDGLVAFPYTLFPPGTEAQVIVAGKPVAFQVVKRDKDKNLAILKLEGSSWPTSSFYRLENLKLGERVVMAGVLESGGNFSDEGVVRDFTPEVINTNILERASAQGAPVFDIEGNILGIAMVSKDGWVSVIPISAIKTIAGL
ncbi:MAG: serine protease [Candidatus Pacebacteria bacterium]|jgi:hypothetical protein|nr:serine protease [Candidatus Paceibacterota bacterium]